MASHQTRTVSMETRHHRNRQSWRSSLQAGVTPLGRKQWRVVSHSWKWKAICISKYVRCESIVLIVCSNNFFIHTNKIREAENTSDIQPLFGALQLHKLKKSKVSFDTADGQTIVGFFFLNCKAPYPTLLVSRSLLTRGLVGCHDDLDSAD